MSDLSKREVIAHDDPTALATRVGWEARTPRAEVKNPAVPNARLFSASPREPGQLIFIECERWVDARSAAYALLGTSEVVVTMTGPELPPKMPTPRYQVRWVGSAMNPSNMPRRMIRLVREEGGVFLFGKWIDERKVSRHPGVT